MQERRLEARNKWPRENDPDRSPACLCHKHGRQGAAICRVSSMRMDPEVGTYFNPKLPRKGEGMSFPPEERLTLVVTPVRGQTLIQNDSHIVARILFNSQRATIVERYKHLIGLRRSIESP